MVTAPTPPAAIGGERPRPDLARLRQLVAICVAETVWRHENGEVSRHYLYNGEPMSDHIASGFATGRTDTPDAEAVCAVMNAAAWLIDRAAPPPAEPAPETEGARESVRFSLDAQTPTDGLYRVSGYTLRTILAALSPHAATGGAAYTVTVGPDAGNENNRRLFVDGSQWAKVYGWDKQSVEARCEILRAALSAPPATTCETCNGRGEIGGHRGQTAESFEYVTEPCPDCAPSPTGGEAVAWQVQDDQEEEGGWREITDPDFWRSAGYEVRALGVIGTAPTAPVEVVEARKIVAQIADIANAVGWQAGEPGMEIAGGILSWLAAHPDQIERFMAEGGDMFMAGEIKAELGALTWRATNGKMMNADDYRQALARLAREGA